MINESIAKEAAGMSGRDVNSQGVESQYFWKKIRKWIRSQGLEAEPERNVNVLLKYFL